jgi:hypothetical protein
MTILSPDILCFLKEQATAAIHACGVAPGETCQKYVNTLGFRAITPGGYPAVWVQDFTMNFSSGLITREDGIRHLLLFLTSQNGPQEKDLGETVTIPPNAIPDHVNLDHAPVYFPGTYTPDANQNGNWGRRPPSNNQYDVIWLAYMLARTGDATALLTQDVKGIPIYERLKLAFAVPEIDPRTELVHTTPERRAVGFIFCDSIVMTGHLLMASLIRYRTALQMTNLAQHLTRNTEAEQYTMIANKIRANIIPVFADHGKYDGWLKASTGISAQPDVWGSIYAIYVGAVTGEHKTHLLQTVVRALEKGDIEFEGALRHVPLPYDFSPEAVWEHTSTLKNRYQNGAYWHTPTGWLIAILQPDYPDLAQKLFHRWIAHLHQEKGKIWECIGWDGKGNQNPAFGPSITLPLGVLSRAESCASMLTEQCG